MSELFLSRDDIVDLTDARTKAGQIKNLLKNGIRHTLNASGWPVVPRSAIDGTPASKAEQQAWQPRKAG